MFTISIILNGILALILLGMKAQRDEAARMGKQLERELKLHYENENDRLQFLTRHGIDTNSRSGNNDIA